MRRLAIEISSDFLRELRLARMEFDDNFLDRDVAVEGPSAEAFVRLAAMLKHEGPSVVSPEIWIRSWTHILRRERRLELDLGFPLVDLGGEG